MGRSQIQATLRQELVDTTVIAVAHRIHTVIGTSQLPLFNR
jgi:ABC-type transport system involved in Fe-S cluster assembly fused permease/ATPase subunit